LSKFWKLGELESKEGNSEDQKPEIRPTDNVKRETKRNEGHVLLDGTDLQNQP
jgi:hypothetical protein